MKWFVITLLFSNLASARTPELLKCLGAEEKAFHLKKETGPAYELNQQLIAEIVQIPNATIEPKVLRAICTAKSGGSWLLLQLSFTEGRKIFQIPEDIDGSQSQMTEGMIEEYLESTKLILLMLLTQVQALAPTPDCLTQEFPALVPFFRDLKYLQEEVGNDKLFEGREVKILNDLKNYPKAIKRCQDRLKKKLNSISTKPPKNP